MRKRRLGERGQALVEAALFLPLLALITMGAVDFGRLYFSYTAIANAAREAAMCTSVGSLCPGGAAAAANAEVNGSLAGPITTTVTVGGNPPSATATVTYSFQAATTAVLGPSTFPLKATATMIIQS